MKAMLKGLLAVCLTVFLCGCDGGATTPAGGTKPGTNATSGTGSPAGESKTKGGEKPAP